MVFFGYIIASLIIGALGRKKWIGFWGFVILSIVCTPLFSAAVLFFGREVKTLEHELY